MGTAARAAGVSRAAVPKNPARCARSLPRTGSILLLPRHPRDRRSPGWGARMRECRAGLSFRAKSRNPDRPDRGCLYPDGLDSSTRCRSLGMTSIRLFRSTDPPNRSSHRPRRDDLHPDSSASTATSAKNRTRSSTNGSGAPSGCHTSCSAMSSGRSSSGLQRSNVRDMSSTIQYSETR